MPCLTLFLIHKEGIMAETVGQPEQSGGFFEKLTSGVLGIIIAIIIPLLAIALLVWRPIRRW
jgi:hypothetical protein